MNIYVAVDDVDAAAKQAVELGGTIAGEPLDVPDVGRMC
jgi:predicted enzyme related to lactoylglutathione lyase